MQQLNTALEDIILNGLFPGSGERNWDWIDVLEIYAPDYIPSDSAGWYAGDAVELFAPVQNVYFVPGSLPFRVLQETDAIPTGAVPYRAEFKSRGDVDKSMGRELNSCSIALDNLSRYAANMLLTYPQNLEGYFVVVRTISQSYRNQGIVIFSGKIDKAGDVDELQVPFTGKQYLGGIETEIPIRTFTADDPQGRPRTDPLYEGFAFVPISGSFTYATTETRRFLFFFKRKKTVYHTEQWSSASNTPLGDPVPIVFGRAQLPLIPVEYKDGGTFVAQNGVAADGRIEAITELRTRTPGFSSPHNFTIHLGDLGGTGTNALPDPQFPNSIVYSRTAYVGLSTTGSAPDVIDEAPLVTALILGFRVATPSAAGVFNTTKWTANPAYLWRYFMSDSRLMKYPAALIEDADCWDTGLYCDGTLRDDSQGERTFIPQDEAANVGTGFRRFHSSGVWNARWVMYYYFGLGTRPELEDAFYEYFDPIVPPAVIAPIRYLRTRYSFNCPLTARVKASDFLFNTLLPSFRGYMVTTPKGHLSLRTERPSRNAFVRGNQAAGISLIPVDNVTGWAPVGGRNKLALIGWGTLTSEVRRVTGTTFSVAGNAITLVSAASGTMTAVRSGATFTGGSASVQASGFVTVGGAPQAGAQVSVTIDGVTVAHTLSASDTVETAAALLAQHVNSDPTLNRYIQAEWLTATPTRVTFYSKLGFLQLEAPGLGFAHASAQEVIEIQHVFDASSILPKSFKWPLGSYAESTNLAIIRYREAKDDFAEVELRINDYAHQTQVGRVNKVEIDGSGIDNFNQAKRIGNAFLSKYREGNFKASWKTDARALLAEEGDLAAVTDDSGGFVNLVFRLEKIKIHPDHSHTLNGRIYSSVMFSDAVGTHEIPLPSSLKYMNAAPPVASNLILADASAFDPNGIYINRLLVTWDFGAFVGGQSARVLYRKSTDTEYVEWANVPPDDNLKGRTVISGLPAGTFFVKVQTESAFGKTAAAGHPETSAAVTGRTNLPPDVTGLGYTRLGNTIRLAWNALSLSAYPDFDHFRIYNGAGAEIGRTAGNSWIIHSPTTAGAFVYQVKAVLRGERLSANFVSVTVNLSAPPSVTGFVGQHYGTQIKWNWDSLPDTDRDFDYFQIYSNAGLTVSVYQGRNTEFLENVVPGQSSYTRYIVAWKGGIRSAVATPFTVTLTTIPAVTGLDETFDGLDFTIFWDEIPNADSRQIFYEVLNVSNVVIATVEHPPYLYRPSATTTTIKVRGADTFGNRGATVTNTLSVPVLVAPGTISLIAQRPVQALISIPEVTDSVQARMIAYTRIETTTTGAYSGVGYTEIYVPGAAREYIVSNTAGGTLFVRVRYISRLGAVSGVSNALTLVFPRFLDDSIDPNSQFLGLTGVLPKIEGGGRVDYSTGNLLSWDQAIVIGAIPSVVTGGYITIPASSYTVNAGQVLYLRYTRPPVDTFTVQVVNEASYSRPAPGGTQFDIVLAFRKTGAGLIYIWDSRALGPGEYVEAGVYIRTLVSREAVLGSVLITKANIKSITAVQIEADRGEFGLVLADQVVGRGYFPYVPGYTYQNIVAASLVGVAVAADNTISKTAATSAWDAAAVSTQTLDIPGGAVRAVAVETNKQRMFGLNRTADTGVTQTEGDFFIFLSSDAHYKVYENGNLLFTSTDLYNSGDVFEVFADYEAGRVDYIRNGQVFYSENAPDFAFPLRFDCSFFHQGATLQAPQIMQSAQGHGWRLHPRYGEMAETIIHYLPASLVNVLDDGHTKITKTAGAATFDAGAYSIESIEEGTGYLKYTVLQLGFDRIFGLSNDVTGAGQTTIDFAFRISTTNGLTIRQNGAVLLTVSGACVLGDVLTILILGGNVIFSRNGIDLYTITAAPIVYPLRVDVSLSTINGELEAIRLASNGTGVGEFNDGLILKGVPFTEDQARSLTAIDTTGRIRGNDRGVVPVFKVTRYAFSSILYIRDEDTVDVQLTIEIEGFVRSIPDDTTNADSVRWVKVTIRDKFGDEVILAGGTTATESWPYTGRGVGANPRHSRKYADPREEATYELTVYNRFGYSKPLYITKGVAQTTTPVYQAKSGTPLDLVAAPRSDVSITLNWGNVSAAVTVFRRLKTESAWTQVATGVNASTYDVTGLAPATLYEFKVQAGGKDSNIAVGTTYFVAVTVAAGARPAPSNLIGTVISSTQINLSWTRNATDNTGVVIERKIGAGAWTAITPDLAAGVTSFQDTGRAASTVYGYRVRNKWATGTAFSEYSNEVTKTTSATNPATTDPSGLAVTDTTTAQISLSWAPNTNAGTAQVEYKIEGAGSWTVANAALANPGAGNVQTYIITGLLSGVTYRARVKNNPSSAYTNEVLGTTDAIPPDDEWDKYCVTPETLYIVGWDGVEAEITAAALLEIFQAGDRLPDVLSFEGNGRQGWTEIAEVSEAWAEALYTVQTAQGFGVRCSESHPFPSAKHYDGTPAAALMEGSAVLIRPAGEILEDVVASVTRTPGRARVIMLKLRRGRRRATYWANRIAAHNMKPNQGNV